MTKPLEEGALPRKGGTYTRPAPGSSETESIDDGDATQAGTTQDTDETSKPDPGASRSGRSRSKAKEV